MFRIIEHIGRFKIIVKSIIYLLVLSIKIINSNVGLLQGVGHLMAMRFFGEIQGPLFLVQNFRHKYL
jgi:hypothetical protein